MKYRHHIGQQHTDNQQHHTQHHCRIHHSAADALGNGGLPIKILRKGGHHIVQPAGLLADANHLGHILRECAGLLQRRGEFSPLRQLFLQPFQKLLLLSAFGILQHHIQTLRQGNSGGKEHGHLAAKAGKLFCPKGSCAFAHNGLPPSRSTWRYNFRRRRYSVSHLPGRCWPQGWDPSATSFCRQSG